MSDPRVVQEMAKIKASLRNAACRSSISKAAVMDDDEQELLNLRIARAVKQAFSAGIVATVVENTPEGRKVMQASEVTAALMRWDDPL